MMLHNVLRHTWIGRIVIAMLLMMSFQSVTVNAAMISTDTIIQTENQQYTKSDLLQKLESTELQQQLADMGVDPQELQQRVASLTPDEISQLNANLAAQPAGEGILGLVGLVFVIFVITDMLCATDLFSFVHCINR
ncbi:PA2779 family protein [uncultured Amphritea sp.]|uniref:PA2779 family protein n=1 Tax=uncultured Amphritea sp. TaxID=981605 RepID=UPI00260F0233|nr:PA2779 family protein [uncultured Amphritea sp.]